MNATLLEIGCGTGQLANYLAATTMTQIYAADMTLPSLRLGQRFAAKYKIPGITFLQMNLFRPCIRAESMDFVISNGVLHHTADTRQAFIRISQLVKRGGFVIVGLYSKVGRLRTDALRHLYGFFGERILVLDPRLQEDISPEQRRGWINDQYRHPTEHKHTLSNVLKWFDEGGFEFISSIPKIGGHMSAKERLFEPHTRGTAADRLLAEAGLMFTRAYEGGLFIVIGRRL